MHAKKNEIVFTPCTKPLKKGTLDTNAAIYSEGSRDMSSTHTIQSNLKFGKFLLQKQAKICMFFRTLPRNIDSCELAMKSGKKFQFSAIFLVISFFTETGFFSRLHCEFIDINISGQCFKKLANFYLFLKKKFAELQRFV